MDAFTQNATTKDGRQTHCKECDTVYHRLWRAANPEKNREKNREQSRMWKRANFEKNRERVRRAYYAKRGREVPSLPRDVSERTLLRRINAKLTEGQSLRVARKGRQEEILGRYFILDAQGNLVAWKCDLENIARELGAIRACERMAA